MGSKSTDLNPKQVCLKKDIKIMLEELSKINYPIHRELLELRKSFMDSFVMRQLRAENQKGKMSCVS